MRDYIKRLIIAGIMVLCISLLFLGGKNTQAETLDVEEKTNHWIWPVNGVITDTYGSRHGSHKGIDIAGESGTPVYAVDGGTVTKSYYSDSYGHVVFIKHPNQLETVYAHLSQRNVEENQIVKQGDIIGQMGNTGDSSGNHLHFEVHENEWTLDKKNAINPVTALEQVDKGESVQAMKKVEKSGQVMPASTKMPSQKESGEVYNHGNIKENKMTKKEKIENNNEEVKQVTHHVKEGDNLWDIAEQYHASVADIKEVNQIENEKIYPNQQLIIQSNELYKYTVQPGDTLGLIAKRTGVSLQQLKEDNNLRTDLIYPDQVLFFNLDNK